MDPRTRIPPLPALSAFVAFARTGGIRRAAVELGMDHAAISRHIRDLEQRLGTPLRDQATGTLTQAGQLYHDRVAPLLEGLATATAEVRNQPRPLTLTCAHGFAYHWLLPRLAAFRRAHPTVELQLRPVDANTTFHVSGVEAGQHAHIGYRRDDDTMPSEPRDLREVLIARPPVFPVVSPAGLAAMGGQPRTTADMRTLPLLLEEDDSEWRLWFRAQGVPMGGITAAGRLWQAHVTLAAARAGEGIALSNPFLLGDDLKTGVLLRVAPTATPLQEATLGAYVLRAPARLWEKPALSCLRAWLLDQVAQQENTTSGPSDRGLSAP